VYDLMRPHVTKLVWDVRSAGRKQGRGNKTDQIDARELADRLYMNKLSRSITEEQASAAEGISTQLSAISKDSHES